MGLILSQPLSALENLIIKDAIASEHTQSAISPTVLNNHSHFLPLGTRPFSSKAAALAPFVFLLALDLAILCFP